MGRDWEVEFQRWAQGPGITEQQKCSNAESVIRKAVEADPRLVTRGVTVSTQGSYQNRTNVRADSDVDVSIVCHGAVFTDIPEGMTDADFGLSPSDYRYEIYKNEVESALKAYLGDSGVTRGNKAFDIHENTNRVDADAVPCFEYRWYRTDGSWEEGTSFFSDRGVQIVNWPEQNYQNGVQKNTSTSRRFKRVVRILKRLRNGMADLGDGSAAAIPSFLIECLVWNVPNEGFGYPSISDDVRWVLAHLFNNTLDPVNCQEWCEINDIKYLFHATQPWSREKTHAFLGLAWDYLGFE